MGLEVFSGTLDESAPIYVGIGSSAGGLEAARELVRHLPSSARLSYIVAQHLSPKHTSMLVELISRETELDVCEIIDGIKVQPGQIYITPPNKDVELSDGHLSLHEPRLGHAPKPDINRLFSSMACDQGNAVVGIVLSGTGSDGAQGIAKIKAASGITIAQTPSTSKYDGMPRAAIQSEAVDLILAPHEIGRVLASLANTEIDLPSPENKDDETSVYAQIIDLTHRTTTIDLTNYRVSTILRRIQRRMTICQIDDMSDYLSYLKSNPDEVSAFVRDAFISVTGFFRDQQAFEALRRMIEGILKRTPEDDHVRIWIPGCASGEEAYTVAILMEEAIQQSGGHQRYRIFATDISHKPLSKARQGIYPRDALKGVDALYLEKYFTRINETYQVAQSLRDHCVFSVHDLTRDPPFSRVDLITCRNLLIYFEPSLQERVLEKLHYSLKPERYLLLGKSENVRTSVPLFKAIDESNQIYQRQEYPGYPRLLQASKEDLEQRAMEITHGISHHEKYSIETLFTELLARLYAPAAVLINENNEMVHAHGDVSPYLSHKAGPCDLNVFVALQDYLRPNLRALVHKARREARLIEQVEDTSHTDQNEPRVVRIQVQPFLPKHPDWLVLTFKTLDKPNLLSTVKSLKSEPKTVDEQIFHEMEHELFSTRESLQTVIEELETTNEELQSTNEELQSANEEFISTNEEFLTTNEELSSSNEELMTLNDELQNKTTNLQEANLHLQAIQDSLETPLLVINHKLRLRRFGPAIDKIIPAEEVKENDLVTALPWRSPIENLEHDLNHVITNNHDITRLIQMEDKHYQLQMTPYKSTIFKEKGVVMIFSDATNLIRTQEAYRLDKDYLEVTLQAIADGVIRCDAKGHVDYLNPVAQSLLEITAEQASGLCLEEILRIETPNTPRENLALAAIQAKTCIYGSENHRITTNKQSELHLQYAAAPIIQDETPIGAVIAFRDFTRQFETLEQMKWRSSHDLLTGLVNRAEMDQRLKRVAAKCQSSEMAHAAFFYMDLDRFKLINDSVGHLAGDELLRQITRQIGHVIRSRDTLARLGGDEFGVLLDNCSLKDAVQIAEKILTVVNRYQFHWDNKAFTLGISIGIVMIGGDHLNDTADILQAADQACQRAKNRGRHRVEVYNDDSDLETQSQRRELEWVSELSNALQEQRFRLYFQPIFDLRDSSTHSWEVLLRLFNTQGELLTPGAFLSPAERCGLIPQIDIWTQHAALSLLSEYRPASTCEAQPPLHLNVSAMTLQDGEYLDSLRESIDTLDVAPQNIHLELKESVALTHYSAAQDFCRQARAMGCRIGLDDFTGNIGAFDYLKGLEIQYVKMLPAILHHPHNHAMQKVLLQFIHDLSVVLEVDVIAKWVNNKALTAMLKENGVTLCQGDAISQPIPLEEFLDATHKASC